MNRKRAIIASIVVVILTTTFCIVNPLLPIITGYGAKNMCSGVFISERSEDSIRLIDLSFSPISLSTIKVNYEDKSVESRFLWHKSKAIYRDNLGAVILIANSDEELLTEGTHIVRTVDSATLAEPIRINNPKIESITEQLITQRSYGGKPFAFMVMHRDTIIGEGYKPGINRDTRLLSWSMAKSFMTAMAGIMVKDYGLDIDAPCGFPEWRDDSRSKITLSDLIQMQSGLEWNEDYGGKSDVNIMLHKQSDMANYAITRPLSEQAGTKWYYSSGSTNIVSQALRDHIHNDSLYYNIAANDLFGSIGAHNAIFETDPAGTLIGSSYVYVRTIDFLRFGQLHLNDGSLFGKRILPEGWVDYCRTPASDSKGEYGAGFWLNAGGRYPSLPKDTYLCKGHDGQFIVIVPSKELVVVALGFSPKSNPIDLDKLVADVIGAL